MRGFIEDYDVTFIHCLIFFFDCVSLCFFFFFHPSSVAFLNSQFTDFKIKHASTNHVTRRRLLR